MTHKPDQSQTVTLTPGGRLEPYAILEQIGVGGTSVVWKAYDALLDRHVAIKQLLLPGNGDDGLMAQRFRAEADMLGRLSESHPRIVRIFDFIDDARGAFLVTEYVAGKSLEQVLLASGDPLTPLRGFKIIHAVTNVLVAIHGQGVVHRDLKPSNLLLPARGGVKVCDLGLAALVADQEGLPAGSVRYMAPELFLGDPATPAADIYALGMIAYEMLAGRSAFNGVFKSVLRDQRNQAMRWMKWHTNARATVPPLIELNDKVTPRLSDLVARMMDKDRARRVHDARELSAAITHHFPPPSPGSFPPRDRPPPPRELRPEVTPARPSLPRSRPRKFPRPRNRPRNRPRKLSPRGRPRLRRGPLRDREVSVLWKTPWVW